MELPAILFLLALDSSPAAQAVAPLPPDWEQIDIGAYHGPEGYYHDSVSGAVVRYYTGPLPHYIGARPSSGERVPCTGTAATTARSFVAYSRCCAAAARAEHERT